MSALAWGLRRIAAAAAMAALAAPLQAEPGAGFALGASGEASVSAVARYPEGSGGLGDPDIGARVESEIRLSADGAAAALKLRIGALASASSASGLYPGSAAPALGLELREAEASALPSPSLALRAGLLLRDLGIGSYGSPVDPFSREEGQAGFWGLGLEWTPARWLSGIVLASADRLARSGGTSGAKDFDGGALVRVTPGALDAALGIYASGAADGELRPIAYLSVSPLSLILSLEAAASFPAKGGADPSGSGRVELRKSLGLGEGSLELAAAYREIFPGRDDAGIAELLMATAPEDLPYAPFAPFYGRRYVELSAFFERSGAFSLSADAIVALGSGSVSAGGRAEAYLGDAGVFVKARLVAGGAGGEFPLLARSSGGAGLEVEGGLEFSF